MRKVLTCLVFIACAARAQIAPSLPAGGTTFLPGGTIFAPLRASYQEPRVGIRKEAGTSRLKLDIGSTFDVLEIRTDSSGGTIRLGAELFTYALTTSAQGFRLQVDAVDGYFGGHIVFAPSGAGGPLLLRLRLMHQSGHLIDGHWDFHNGHWIDNKLPLPYTRDFGELAALYSWSWRLAALSIYSGISYASLARPDNVARYATLHGFELHSTGLAGPVAGRPFCLYVADHFTLSGIPVYYGTNDLEAGVKFGAWDGAGIRLYLSYYRGLEIFSQYYDVHTDEWGIGFALDGW